MNFRNIALVAALASVAAVNAQSFELRAGAGATLNGNTFVVAPGGAFSVEIWFNAGSATLNNVTSVGVGLAFDRTNATSTTGLDGTGLAGKINAAAAGWQNASFGLGAVGAAATVRAGTVQTATSNIGGPGTPRALVVNRQYSAGTGSPISLSGSTLVGTMTFTHNIANGDTYGDAGDETGLQMYISSLGGSTQGGTSAVNGLPGNNLPGQVGSAKYAVQAVPEPGTMAALGLGLAAIARRRRNKK